MARPTIKRQETWSRVLNKGLADKMRLAVVLANRYCSKRLIQEAVQETVMLKQPHLKNLSFSSSEGSYLPDCAMICHLPWQ